MLDGEISEWYNNSQLKYRWLYKSGKLIGKRVMYDEKGKQIR